MEVATTPLALRMEAGGLEPMVDPAAPGCRGSALYLVASLVNHRCRGANVAPSFLDSLIDTQFVATAAIVKGDELFFDYAATVPNLRDKRLRNFLAHGFVCGNCDCLKK